MTAIAPPSIVTLPPGLCDQIAAGEVVERPASVVKELVENALDAGARTVRVEIDGGGLERILVVDDGHGMRPNDAILALGRHATSKIAAFDDLFRLATFGFRGEALPSIASVSRFRIVTRPADALAATEVVVVAGEAPVAREIGGPAGTAIEVRDLFFNVPARRKFLKSVGTESGHVGDTCLDLALARADVSLTLVRDGKVARQYLRATDRAARAFEVLGTRDGARNSGPQLAHAVGDRTRVRVEVFLSPPERARNGAAGLHLLVNGRSVRDRALARAVAMAYGSVLDPGRYPVGVVYVDVPAEDVDVNVHPQKAEVRFARGRALYDDVTRALAPALARLFMAPSAAIDFLDGGALFEQAANADPNDQSRAADAAIAPGARELAAAMAQQNRPFSTARDAPLFFRERSPSSVNVAEQGADRVRAGDDARSGAEGIPVELPGRASSDDDALHAAPTVGRYASLRFVAQVRATYLLCEADDGLVVIDQHAAAERVTFSRLRAAHQKRAVSRQQLLVPEIATVTSSEAELVDEARDDLLAFGLDARRIGDGRVAIHGSPALLSKASPTTLLRDLVGELSRSGDRTFGDATDLVLATMACHGSVRAGDVLHPDECTALLRALDEVDFAGYCPHGRPIVTTLSFVELEKKVGRR